MTHREALKPFTGPDGQIYIADPFFDNCSMGPFNNEQAARNARDMRANAIAFTHGGSDQWYYQNDEGEPIGPFPNRETAQATSYMTAPTGPVYHTEGDDRYYFNEAGTRYGPYATQDEAQEGQKAVRELNAEADTGLDN